MDDRPVGRPKKENPMIKRWIFLDKTGYEAVTSDDVSVLTRF